MTNMTGYEIGIDFFETFKRLHEAECAACNTYCANRNSPDAETLKQEWYAASRAESEWVRVFSGACYDGRITSADCNEILGLLYGIVDGGFDYDKDREIVECIGEQLRLKSYEDRLMYIPDYSWGDWVPPVLYGTKPGTERDETQKTAKNAVDRTIVYSIADYDNECNCREHWRVTLRVAGEKVRWCKIQDGYFNTYPSTGSLVPETVRSLVKCKTMERVERAVVEISKLTEIELIEDSAVA